MAGDIAEISVGEALGRMVAGGRQPLNTVVNVMAERYEAILDRTAIATSVRMDDMYRAVLSQFRGEPLGAKDIAAFPGLVRHWFHLNAPGDQEYKRGVLYIGALSFVQLVVLIDRLERRL